MRNRLILFVLLMAVVVFPVSAQDATPDTSQPASIAASGQLSTNGMVMIDTVFSPTQGWIAIHADANGVPGPVIGIAPVIGGASASVPVMIDVAGATPVLWAGLHIDDNTIGAFEFGKVPGADEPVMVDGNPVMTTFDLVALKTYDQQMQMNSITVAASVLNRAGWMVIHQDNGGQPGPVLGQALLRPGTVVKIIVPLDTVPPTMTVWAMLHEDDGTAGVYEFDGASGLDNPITVNGGVATAPLNLSEQPVVLNAAGVPLMVETSTEPNTIPFLNTFGQDAMESDTMGTLQVESVLSIGPGWIDVHADAEGHPGKSLGMQPVADGVNQGVAVMMDAMMDPTSPPMTLPFIVWPMLHTDDGQIGVYEYMVIPGLDLPVILNGAAVSYPVSIGGEAEVPTITPTAEMTATTVPADDDDDDATAEATDDMATPEATADGGEGTPEATDDGTGGTEGTAEAPEGTDVPAPPVEATVEVTIQVGS